MRLCTDALESGVKINKVFYTSRFYKNFSNEIEKILKFSKKTFIVEEKIIELISDTKNPQGIVCICEFFKNYFNISKETKKILILDSIQNPSNLGALIRTCDALKFDGVVISETSCDIYNPKVLRGSMGSIFRTKIFVAKRLKETIMEFNKNGISTVAMVVNKNSMDIRELKTLKRLALVIGNEGNGISDDIIKTCTNSAFIPINEKTESLNASVAAGIAMWEISKIKD